MSYAGSEAMSLAYAEGSQAYERASLRPALEVVNGAGLDARVRQGVSTDIISMVKLAIAVVVTLVILGACRIGICSATLTILQSTSGLRTEIKSAQALETDLKVTRSVLADTSRIDRIATENYGMVKAEDYENISIPLVAAPAPVEEETVEEPAAEDSVENPMAFLFGTAEAEETEEERIYTTMAMPAADEAEADADASASDADTEADAKADDPATQA